MLYQKVRGKLRMYYNTQSSSFIYNLLCNNNFIAFEAFLLYKIAFLRPHTIAPHSYYKTFRLTLLASRISQITKIESNWKMRVYIVIIQFTTYIFGYI